MNIDKYNLITPYIKRANQDINRFRKFFTQSLENKPEHLKQWISYLSETNLLEAAFALKDLVNPTEELKEIVLDKTINVSFNHQVILTLLYLNEHKKIIEYLNNIENEKTKDDGDDLQYSYEQYDEEFTNESFSEKEGTPATPKSFVKVYESYIVPESLSKENHYVVKQLLDKSDYNLIVDYMLDLSKSNVQDTIYSIARSIDKIVVNEETKCKIKEIINNLITSHKYCLAIQIVFALGLKFEDYVDIKPEEYMIILSKNYHSLDSLNFEKVLYLRNHNLKGYFNYIKDLNLDNELAIHTLKVILNLIINGDNPFRYEDKIKDLVKHYQDNNLFIVITEINELFCKVFNTIIKTRPNDLIEVIKLFCCTNPFMYNEIQKSILYIRVRNNINEQIQLNSIIDNITSNNSISDKDKVFIYMNSHFKSLISLTEYIVKFINIHNQLARTCVYDLFSDYYFYARINKIDKKNGQIKIKIMNIYEKNKTRFYKSELEKILGHSIDVGLIIKTRIFQYIPYNTSFRFKYVGIGNKTEFSKEDYETIYSNLINNISISDEMLDKMPKSCIINYDVINESNRIYDIYCKALIYSYKNYKDYIKVLEKDYINPFRWPSSGAESIETLNSFNIKGRIFHYFGMTPSSKKEDSNDGFAKRTSSYISFVNLIESDASNDEIIKIYMNTYNRHTFPLDSLLNLLINNERITPDENGMVDLKELFRDYTIYCSPISYDDTTKEALIECHLLWAFKFIYKTNKYPSLIQNHRYLKFKLDYFDTNSKSIYLYHFSKSKHTINSRSLMYLDRQFINMRKYGLSDEIENNIKNAAPIELFKEKITLKKDNTNQINRHINSYILTISKYIDDLDIIVKLIDSLGDNNIFKYSDNMDLNNINIIKIANGYSFSKDKFNTACQKEKDINKILYIYLNTYLRMGNLPINELLNNFCIVNHLFNQEIDINDKTNIELVYSEEEDKIILNNIYYDKNNTNIVVLNNNLIKDKVYLANLIKYHPNTNTLTFKIVKKKKISNT